MLPSGEPGHRLLTSRRGADGWSAPVLVVEGSDLFANWADIPAIAVAGDGTLYAHWLAKTAPDTYAYSIFLARSQDDGGSWTPMGPLNDDETPTEHGFVSFITQGEGVRAFWLDGREMVHGGAMGVRTALIDDEIGPSLVLDDRVCECCGTDAVITDQGALVVTRDRSDDEIRDISLIRQMRDQWSPSARVAADDWRIEGCPVNGPAVAASGAEVAVAWYTAGGDGPKVQFAISDDAGATFGQPERVDDGRPLGRVDVVDDAAGGFVLSWLEGGDQTAEIHLRRLVDRADPGPSTTVARTSPSRASGFPRLVRVGHDLYLAFVDVVTGEPSQVRVLEIPLTSLG